jgi:HPt (histidine-containing phosphotransfer) domain-containing protein
MQNNMKTTITTIGSIDLSYIRVVANGNAPFEAEMLLSLQSEIEQKMEAMRHDLENGHREGVRLCAHSLKNLFGMLSCSRLRDAFLLMETESMSVNNDWLRRHYALLKSDWMQVQGEITRLLATYDDRAAAA